MLDWSDTRFTKYLYTVEVVEVYWIRSTYVIRTKTNKTASTNGTLGFCSCDTFHIYTLAEKGKTPCKHLWVCKDCRDIKIEQKREYMRNYHKKNLDSKNKAIYENMRETKDDPNSLFNNEEFVKNIIKKGR
ncbi:MAG TPA: hypothetical protein PLK11_08250 [Methanofastidiosum sp.]|nr:hypothetical protein [Methanofastidiosum sp.]HOR88836.1 hypothetical protein [Methanofastidiosum sp.]HPL01316.1 hypothetical protein [Methanofastidiosum sp.]